MFICVVKMMYHFENLRNVPKPSTKQPDESRKVEGGLTTAQPIQAQLSGDLCNMTQASTLKHKKTLD